MEDNKNQNMNKNAETDNSVCENEKNADIKECKTAKTRKSTSKISKNRERLKKAIMTAMFIAFAVVTKSLTLINLSAFGIKISLAGIFTFFPAALFGPIYGGISSMASDLIGFLIKADGAYNPLLSLTAFLGGFVKGIIWRIITKGASKRIRISFISVFAVLGIFGIVGNISLIKDGILPEKTIIAIKEELPLKTELAKKDLSPISKMITDLAMYNKDSYSYVSVNSDNGKMEIPSKASVDGEDIKITKLNKDSLKNAKANDKIYISKGITKIDSGVFGESIPENITIVSSKDSAAEKFANDNKIKFEESDAEIFAYDFVRDDTKIKFISENSIVKSSDTYRKYLAGYTNLAVGGTEFVMVVGILFMILEMLLSKRKANKNKGGYLKIASSICASGLLVTTINTFILRSFLPAWKGRMFLVLWVPRAAEELIVCMMQAYVISLLYGVIVNTKLGRYFPDSKTN